MKLLNASLMCTGDNGFTKQMRSLSGLTWYKEINPGIPNFNEELIRLVDEFEVDCVYLQIQTPGVISENTASYIGSKCIVFNHSGDVRAHLDQWYYDIGKHITCTFFTNSVDVRKLKEVGIESKWMEIGVDEAIFKDYPNKIPNAPRIVFLANNYGSGYFPLSQHRIEVVQALKQEFGDNFGVFGSGWGNTASGDFNGNQYLEALQISSADIVLNISHFDYEAYSSDRLLRSLACKTMVISRIYPGIEQQYELSKELVGYIVIEDLIDLCYYYLKRPEEREVIALRGQQKVLNTNTFSHMSKNIQKYYEIYQK